MLLLYCFILFNKSSYFLNVQLLHWKIFRASSCLCSCLLFLKQMCSCVYYLDKCYFFFLYFLLQTFNYYNTWKNTPSWWMATCLRSSSKVCLNSISININGASLLCLIYFQTVRFKRELERNITMKLGYANAKIYKCEDEGCPRPLCFKYVVKLKNTGFLLPSSTLLPFIYA